MKIEVKCYGIWLPQFQGWMTTLYGGIFWCPSREVAELEAQTYRQNGGDPGAFVHPFDEPIPPGAEQNKSNER